MRVLVTGAAGFIGSHLTDYLLDQGHEVVGLDKLDETASYGYLQEHAAQQPGFKMVWHDLRAPIAPEAPSKNLLGKSFDWVCHLAAASHVDRSIREPMEFIADNVVGTGNLLEWARSAQPDLKRFLYFSTDEVYGPADRDETFTEHDRHWPNNPYASTKAGAEALAPAWANTWGTPICVTHCTNIYGPRQHPEKFIPLVRRAVLDGKTVQIHAREGVPSSRFYVYVQDVCRAVVTVLERGGTIGSPTTGKYNISGAEELSNLDVAQQIAAKLGRDLLFEQVEFVTNRPKHDQRYSVGGTELQKLGWAPRVSFDEGLTQTLGWYAKEDFETSA